MKNFSKFPKSVFANYNKVILTLTLWIFTTMMLPNQTQGCTAWGVIKSDELLIAKNRDFYPGNQKFIAVKKEGKYSFFGLYADNQYNNNYKIRMGINQEGLVVFMTFATAIPLDLRTAKVKYYQIMENILEQYSNIDKIYADSKILFKNSAPINYIFADKNQALICEIGLNNDYRCKKYSRKNNRNITFSHTNHYNIASLKKYNLTPVTNQQTSYLRLNKINQLMQNNIAKLDFDQFINFSLNTESKNDNPLAEFDQGYSNTFRDNSIFRTFNSHPDRKSNNHQNSSQDVSTMIIKLPTNQQDPIKLYLRIINKITDLNNDQKYSQNIEYTEATTTLENALKNPDNINYQTKSCKRNMESKLCL